MKIMKRLYEIIIDHMPNKRKDKSADFTPTQGKHAHWKDMSNYQSKCSPSD
jgi:hypothetical protein